MSGIDTARVAITTAGNSGSATGSGTTPALKGYLLAIYLDYHASAPATTDVTVAYGSPSMGSIVVNSNSANDVFLQPRKQACDTAAAAVAGVYDCWPLAGTLSISVAQADALTDCVVAYVIYQKA